MPNSNGDIENLQMEIAHLQREFEQLSAVVLGQGKQLDQQQRLIEVLRRQILRGKDDDSTEEDVRDPLAERPPHY